MHIPSCRGKADTMPYRSLPDKMSHVSLMRRHRVTFPFLPYLLNLCSLSNLRGLPYWHCACIRKYSGNATYDAYSQTRFGGSVFPAHGLGQLGPGTKVIVGAERAPGQVLFDCRHAANGRDC